MAEHNGLAVALYETKAIPIASKQIYESLGLLVPENGRTASSHTSPTSTTHSIKGDDGSNLLSVVYQIPTAQDNWIFIHSSKFTQDQMKKIIVDTHDARYNDVQYILPMTDFDRIVWAYPSTSHKGIDCSPSKFVRLLEDKVQEDFIRGGNLTDRKSRKIKYLGEDLVKYIDRETHFALENGLIARKFEYNQKDNRFEFLSPQDYGHMRNLIISALVNRAISVFTDGKKDEGYTYLKTNLAELLIK